MPSQDKLRNWFVRYRDFVKFWTTIAEREGVDVLGIGSELNALSSTSPIKAIPDLYNYFSNPARQEQHEKRALRFENQLKEQDLWVRGLGNYTLLEDYLDDKIASQVAWAKQATFAGKANRLQLLNTRRKTILGYWE